MASTSATQSWSYDIWLWLGLGVTSFVTARVIARQLSEVIRLNEIHTHDDDDPPPPTPTPPATVSGIEGRSLSEQPQEDERQQEQEQEQEQGQQRLPLQHRSTSASASTRAGSSRRRSSEKQRPQQPEDRIPIEVLSELAFCSSYDIREATNKIIAERWAKSEKCKEALFSDLKSDSASRREYGEHLLDTLRDYNVDPAPPAPPPGERSAMTGIVTGEADIDDNLQTLEEVLQHALISSYSINSSGNDNNNNDNNSTTITTVDPETNQVTSTVITDITPLNSNMRTTTDQPSSSGGMEDQETMHELERHGNPHTTWPAIRDGRTDADEGSMPEIVQPLPQPRPSQDQSPEEAERRRGRREAVVYGVESDNGEADMLRVIRPGADPLDVHLRGLASSRRGWTTARRRSESSNDHDGVE